MHLKQLHFFQKLIFFPHSMTMFSSLLLIHTIANCIFILFFELIAILSHSHHSYSFINYKTFFFSIHSRYVILCFYIFLMGFWRKIKFYYTFMNIIYTSSCLWWIKQKCHWPRPLLIVHLDICNCFLFYESTFYNRITYVAKVNLCFVRSWSLFKFELFFNLFVFQMRKIKKEIHNNSFWYLYNSMILSKGSPERQVIFLFHWHFVDCKIYDIFVLFIFLTP